MGNNNEPSVTTERVLSNEHYYREWLAFYTKTDPEWKHFDTRANPSSTGLHDLWIATYTYVNTTAKPADPARADDNVWRKALNRADAS